MDVELTKIGERGQIVIPLSIRENIQAPKGTLFSIAMLDKNILVMKKVDRKELLADFNKLRASVKKFGEAELIEKVKQWKKAQNRP